jgi:PAS domain S-box-containing protein
MEAHSPTSEHRARLTAATEEVKRLMTIDHPAIAYEYEAVMRSGEMRWTQWNTRAFFDAQGQVSEYQSVGRDVDERKRAELALAESEERFRTVIEQQTEMVCRWKPDFTVTLANEAMCRFLEAPREQVLGHHLAEHILDPQHRARFMAAAEEVKGLMSVDHPVCTYEYLASTRSGRRWTLWNARAFLDGHGHVIEYLSVGRDIDERKRAELKLAASEERYRRVLETSPDGIIYFDLEGHCLMANQQAAQQQGFRDTEEMFAHRQNIFEAIIPAERPGAVAKLRRIVETGQPQGNEYTLMRVDGSTLPVEISSSLVRDAARQPIGLIGVSRDISLRRQAEQALRESKAKMEQALRLEALGRLSSGVAHDFGNILAIIRAEGEYLLGAPLLERPSLEQELHNILRTVDAGRGITQQLSAFSRGQALQPEILHLNTLVRDMEALLRRLLGADIMLTLALAERPLYFWGENSAIDRILINLATNAKDALPQGGQVTIATTLRAVEAAEAERIGIKPGTYALLVLSDSGPGISAEHLAHILEPFFTTKETLLRSGLGLSVVYGLMQQHGGTVSAESQVGQGTCFTLYFPTLDEDVLAAAEAEMGML